MVPGRDYADEVDKALFQLVPIGLTSRKFVIDKNENPIVPQPSEAHPATRRYDKMTDVSHLAGQ